MSEYRDCIAITITGHFSRVKIFADAKNWTIHGRKFVLHARKKFKLAVVLISMSKYFAGLFQTTNTTNFYPSKIPTVRYIALLINADEYKQKGSALLFVCTWKVCGHRSLQRGLVPEAPPTAGQHLHSQGTHPPVEQNKTYYMNM